jgi:hypothetical protein
MSLPTTTNQPDATKAITFSLSLENVLHNEIANELEHSIKFKDGYSMDGVEYCSDSGEFIVSYTKDDDDVRIIECPIKGYDKDADDLIVKIPKRLLKIADLE